MKRAKFVGMVMALGIIALVTVQVCLAQTTPSPALLVLEKADGAMAIVDPATLKVVGRVAVGKDPHEIEASPDGKAYVSNYGGLDSMFNTITVVDLSAQTALDPISLGALHSPHGLAFTGGKLYFTVETAKAFGRYDPSTRAIDWVLGTGQDRTHMVIASRDGERVFTSNVSSGTISIVEHVMPPAPPGMPPGGPRKTWEVTNVVSGRGSEGFDLSPDEKFIWAANAQDSTVTIIDVVAKKTVATFPVSVHGNRLKFTHDGKYALISGAPAGGFGAAGPNFAIVDVGTRKEIKKLEMGGGSGGIQLTPDGTRAFVAVAGKNKVSVVDLKTLEVNGEIAVGNGPDGMAWAGK